MVSKEKLYRYGRNIMLVCWLGVLVIAPLGVILGYIDRDPYMLGMYLALTMLFYWITGVLTALLKRWSLD